MIRNYPFILMLFCWARNPSSDQMPEMDAGGSNQLQIVDSLIINTLPSETFIQDIHPENGNILVMQRKGRGQILMEVDANGNILQTFEHPTEGPQRAGSILLSACYFKDGFALIGSFGYLLFTDSNFEPLERKRIPMGYSLSVIPGFKNLQVLNSNNKSFLVLFYGPHTKIDNREAAFYEEYDLLSIYDPETEEFLPVGKLPETSILRNGNAHYFINTLYQVVGERVKAIITDEDLLYTLDPLNGNMDFQQIPFDDFVLHNGYSLGQQGIDEQSDIREISGTIGSFLQIGEKELFIYTSGLTLNARLAIAREEEDKEAWEKLRKAMPPKYLIRQNGEAISDYLSLPSRVGHLTMVDAGGNIWASQNVDALDKEPDVVTIYKLKIIGNQ